MCSFLEADTFIHRYIGALCEQYGLRLNIGQKLEFRAVCKAKIYIDLCFFGREKLPLRMLDLVFVGSVFAAFCVAPVMFDDEFAFRSGVRNAEALAALDAYC